MSQERYEVRSPEEVSVSEEDGDSREESKDSERSRPSAALGGPRNRGLLRRT